MSITANWGTKYFSVAPNKVVPFDKLSTSFGLKTEANNDTSGTPSTNTRGRDLQTISFSTTYAAAAGTDPRAEIDSWYNLIGAIYPLYIAGKQFGVKNMQLTKVNVDEIQTSPDGIFLLAKLTVTLTEYQAQTAAISTKATTDSQTSTVSGLELGKVAALNAKASSEDKQSITDGGSTSGSGAGRNYHGGGDGKW